MKGRFKMVDIHLFHKTQILFYKHNHPIAEISHVGQ